MLSKSDYMLFLKHPAWLWLKKHDKDKLPPIDASTQAMFDAGHMFESYAEKLFPDGMSLGFDNYSEYLSLPSRTQQALDNGATTIFQGRFEFGQLTFICDVIQVVGDKTVDLIEIKSSTKAKPDHEYDLAFQMVVLEGLGLTVRNISVVHVNNAYIRDGEIDFKLITATTDVTNAVKSKRDFTIEQTKAALATLASGEHPDFSPTLCGLGAFNEWLDIFRHLNDLEPGSIYDLCQLNADILKNLETDGISKIADIPENFILKPKQSLQAEANRLGAPIIHKDKIKDFLNSLVFPLYFFDYETLANILPYFDGMKPYKQYPFQYSLHILSSPDAELRHEEYLHRDNSNPLPELSEMLKSQIGEYGSVVTWNMGFEKGCNDVIGELLPEYTQFYDSLNERIVDLMLPFSNGWYVDKEFKGSASIKNILPVIVPELSYKTLGIQEGATAQRLWMESVLDGKHDLEKEQILNDLVEYCRLDTLAMVEIYRRLKSVIG